MNAIVREPKIRAPSSVPPPLSAQPFQPLEKWDTIRRPDLTNTHPAVPIGPFPQWSEPARIVTLDPGSK